MAKENPKWQKILSVVLYISGTIMSLGFFFIFSKFWFFGLLGQKTVKNEENVSKWGKHLSVTLHISGTIYIWLSFMLHMCKMISPGIFLSFFQNFKFCLLCSLSPEPYIIWLSSIIHTCKIIISSGFFSFFQNFDFLNC